jgi:hypothetical protein
VCVDQRLTLPVVLSACVDTAENRKHKNQTARGTRLSRNRDQENDSGRTQNALDREKNEKEIKSTELRGENTKEKTDILYGLKMIKEHRRTVTTVEGNFCKTETTG